MPRQRGHAVVFVLALLACLVAAALLVHDSGRLAAQKYPPERESRAKERIGDRPPSPDLVTEIAR